MQWSHDPTDPKHKCRTSREPVPNFQPVVLAVSISTWQGIVLQVKGEEGEGDIHSGRDNDDEGALEVVGVFVGKSRGLDEARGTGKVTGTVWTWDEDRETKRCVH